MKNKILKLSIFDFNFLGVSALVTIEDNFTLVHFIFNEKEKVDTIQKKIIVNPKLIDIAKKLIFTKILYDSNKNK
jgi:5-methylthioribose kinase